MLQIFDVRKSLAGKLWAKINWERQKMGEKVDFDYNHYHVHTNGVYVNKKGTKLTISIPC